MYHCLNCGRDYDYPTQGALCPHTVGGPNEGKPWPKSGKLRRLQENIADHLEEICKLFTQRPKITIVIRTPWIEGEGDVVLSDDDFGAAITAIRKLQCSMTANVMPADAAPPAAPVAEEKEKP